MPTLHGGNAANDQIRAANAEPAPARTVPERGTFDTVHTGRRCGQTKALGQGLRDLVPGAEVRLPENHAENPSIATRADSRPVSDFQLARPGGGLLVVREHTLLDWVDEPVADLPTYDVWGDPLEVTDQHPDSGQLGSRFLAPGPVEEIRARIASGDGCDRDAWMTRILRRRPLADLDPATDAQEIEQRRSENRDAAHSELATLLGLPHRCGHCDNLATAEIAERAPQSTPAPAVALSA